MRPWLDLLLLALALTTGACDASRCLVQPFVFEQFCVPRTVPAGETFTARVGVGCGGHGTEPPTCTFDDSRLESEGVLLLQPTQLLCSVGDSAAICRIDEALCALPPLPAGSYTVVFNTDTRRVVDVVDGTGETDCSLDLF